MTRDDLRALMAAIVMSGGGARTEQVVKVADATLAETHPEPTPSDVQGEPDDAKWDDPAYVLAMLCLQSERYAEDPEFSRAVREVMAEWKAGARLSTPPEGAPREPTVTIHREGTYETKPLDPVHGAFWYEPDESVGVRRTPQSEDEEIEWVAMENGELTFGTDENGRVYLRLAHDMRTWYGAGDTIMEALHDANDRQWEPRGTFGDEEAPPERVESEMHARVADAVANTRAEVTKFWNEQIPKFQAKARAEVLERVGKRADEEGVVNPHPDEPVVTLKTLNWILDRLSTEGGGS